MNKRTINENVALACGWEIDETKQLMSRAAPKSDVFQLDSDFFLIKHWDSISEASRETGDVAIHYHIKNRSVSRAGNRWTKDKSIIKSK